MKNVSCEIIQDILPLYHDHVCSAASSAMVEEHLKDCAACTRVLAEMDDDKIEADLLSETHEILKRHEKKERSLAFKTGIVIAGILILPVIIVLMLTLPGYSDFKTDAVLIASMLLVAGLTVVPLVSTRKKFSKTIIFSLFSLRKCSLITEAFCGSRRSLSRRYSDCRYRCFQSWLIRRICRKRFRITKDFCA